MQFAKMYHNPIDFIKSYWPDADYSHITYDPDMKGGDIEYWRIEQCSHDGTSIFSTNILQEVVLPIINMGTYFKETEPDNWGCVKGIKYTIGDIRHVIVFGRVKLGCGKEYPGQRERVRIPVKCEYIYR